MADVISGGVSGTTRAGRLAAAACAAVLFLGPFAVVLWHQSRMIVLWDLSYVLEHAYRISLGDIPYNDFAIPHPLLTFLVQAAIIRLFDASYLHHALYCAIVAGLTAVLANRVIRYQLARSCAGGYEVEAFVLCLPLVFLNGYCILSQPFYDPDCAFWLLVALASLLWARSRPQAGWRHLMAGVLLVVPIFFKQNIGVAGFAAVQGSLLVSAVRHPVERRPYAAYVAGSVLGILGAVALIQAWVGVRLYYYWTVTYAMQKRPFSARRIFFIYENWRTWLALACAACGVVVSVQPGRPRWLRRFALLLAALPFAYASFKVFSRTLAWESQYFWAIPLVGGSAAGIAEYFGARGRFESTMPVVAAAVAHGSFMSQGVGGSSYGVWPFLTIALAAPFALLMRSTAVEDRRLVRVLAVLFAGLLLTVGFLHVSRDERLRFADTRGSIERASLPRMEGLSAPGSHVTDFERIVRRCAQLIPPSDALVLVPGEDPFFYATRRRPRFPALMFDDTITPYGAAGLEQMLRERRIDWVVIKTRLQLRKGPWTPLASFDPSRDYQIVDVLPAYVILKRRSEPDRVVP
jgi:hypothetical protein